MQFIFHRQAIFMKRELKINSKGQSLVEVVASLAMVILIVAALVNLVTASLRSSQFAKTSAQANKYAQEGIEWVRSLRDQASSWDAFKSQIFPVEPITVWCLKSFSLPDLSGGCSSEDYILGTTFRREALVSKTDATETALKVKITVYWKDQVGEHQSRVETLFTDKSKWK